MKIIATTLIAVLGLVYHLAVAPRIHQGEQRQRLAEEWNLSNEANSSTCCFYSTRGLFSETLTVTLVGDTDPVDEDSFIGEVVQGDASTNERTEEFGIHSNRVRRTHNKISRS
jgi:hypothetical protein